MVAMTIFFIFLFIITTLYIVTLKKGTNLSTHL